MMKKRLLTMVICYAFLVLMLVTSIPVYAASNQLNIVTTFGTSETSIYGVPNAFTNRFNTISSTVADIYLDRFGITLNFTVPSSGYVISSVADSCRASSTSGNYDSFCQHVSNQYCSNDGPYHCTNSGVIREDVFPLSGISSTPYQMHITATRVCNMNSNKVHGSINGMHYSDKFILIRDTDYSKMNAQTDLTLYTTKYVAKTVAHEIGHAYGVEDHYSSVDDGNPVCIWGYYKDRDDVVDQLKMCLECQMKIMSNASRYNHS